MRAPAVAPPSAPATAPGRRRRVQRQHRGGGAVLRLLRFALALSLRRLDGGLFAGMRVTIPELMARKTDVGPLRLLHFFALAYVGGWRCCAPRRSWITPRGAEPVAIMGRHSLSVFLLGMVSVLRWRHRPRPAGTGLLPHLAVNLGGIGLLWPGPQPRRLVQRPALKAGFAAQPRRARLHPPARPRDGPGRPGCRCPPFCAGAPAGPLQNGRCDGAVRVVTHARSMPVRAALGWSVRCPCRFSV